MSFLKISDPAKRDLMVKEYLELKKNIRDNLLSERTREQQLQTDLSKFFKPITETQKATAREITKELKPIKEGIENLPQAITFPAYPSIQTSKEPSEGEDTQYIGDLAEKCLRKFATKDEADTMYGLYDKGGKFYIGNKLAIIVDNDLIVGRDEYEDTPGLLELIVSKKPDRSNYTPEDEENYARLMIKTNALHVGNNPESKKPKSNKSDKWTNILSEIWKKRREYEGSGVIVIPSDPNTLLERLDLLLAGNTGVKKELVSICAELKRQGVLDVNAYKKLISNIKNDST